jgi:hypothetical protein
LGGDQCCGVSKDLTEEVALDHSALKGRGQILTEGTEVFQRI